MKKISQLMGYERVVRYTLTREAGSSLKEIKARPVSEVKAKGWERMKRHRKNQKVYGDAKTRWEL